MSNKTDRSDKCPEVAHKHTHDTSEEHAQTVSRKLILIQKLLVLFFAENARHTGAAFKNKQKRGLAGEKRKKKS